MSSKLGGGALHIIRGFTVQTQAIVLSNKLKDKHKQYLLKMN